MKIPINSGLQVNFADMVKDVKLIYTNVGNIPFIVDFVDPAGETKTTTVLPGGRYIISSNDGNPTGGKLTFRTEGGQTYMVVSKVQEDATIDGVDEKGYLAGTASKDDITNLQQQITTLSSTVSEVYGKVQNQSATSSNTSFTGNLTVSGTISTGSMSDIASKVSQNQSEISGIQTDVSTLALSKLPYGTLHFNQGKLSVANWTSVVLPLPFSLAIEYEVESWDGISYEYNNEFSFFNCTNADWDVSGYPIYGFRLTKSKESQLSFTLGGCGGEGMGASRGWAGNITLPTGRHTVVLAVLAPDASGNSPASIPVYIDGSMAGNLVAAVGKHNASVSFQRPLVINERGVYAGGTTFNEFEIALSRISIFNFDISAESAPYTIADYAAGKLIPPALKPSQVSLALDNYVIERNSTTKLVKDASGHSYDATVTGSVAGDNDQSIKAFVDEIKTQINQSNG